MSAEFPIREQPKSPLVFDAELIGRRFRELGVDVVEGETTFITSRWFRGGEDADLFIWNDGEKRIIKLQFCLFGQVIEWNPLDGTRTGAVIEEESSGPTGPSALSGQMALSADSSEYLSGQSADQSSENASEVIRFDAKAQASVVEQALEVLRFVPELADTERQRLIRCLKDSPKLHPKARERALKAWAPKAQEISTTVRPTFWKRIRKWFLGAA